MSRVSIRVPNCTPCCQPSAGGGPLIGTPTCASRTGSGNLRGWSKFQNHNSGDWNTRKHTRVDYAISPSNPLAQAYYYLGVGSACAGSPNIWTYLRLLTASATWDVASNARVGSVTSCTGNACDGDAGSSTAGHPFSNLSAPGSTSTGAVSDTAHRTTYNFGFGSCAGFKTTCLAACPNVVTAQCSAIGSELVQTNQTDSFLSIPDTVEAALARGTSSTGTLCKTTAGTIGSTSAGSATQIAISGTTSVKVTIPLSLLTVAQDYEMDIVLNRYTAGGGAFVNTITVTVAFTAGATSENLVYDVPVNTDFDYEFDHAENLAAA